MSHQLAPTTPPPLTADAAIDRAAKGDASVLPLVRRLVHQPEVLADWGGDLARVAANAVIDQTAGTNLLLREALRHKADLLRAELAGAGSPLGRIVADRVVMSWLQVHYAEALFAQSKDLTFAQWDSLQRRIDRCHRRLLSAAKALAAIRRMALPVVLAQVNMAAAVPPRPSPA